MDDGSECDNDSCQVGLSITNNDLLTCDIPTLDSGGQWDFQKGAAIGYEVRKINHAWITGTVCFSKDFALVSTHAFSRASFRLGIG